MSGDSGNHQGRFCPITWSDLYKNASGALSLSCVPSNSKNKWPCLSNWKTDLWFLGNFVGRPRKNAPKIKSKNAPKSPKWEFSDFVGISEVLFEDPPKRPSLRLSCDFGLEGRETIANGDSGCKAIASSSPFGRSNRIFQRKLMCPTAPLLQRATHTHTWRACYNRHVMNKALHSYVQS